MPTEDITKVLCLCVDLVQRLPHTLHSRQGSTVRKPDRFFKLLSHFDEMRIRIAEMPSDVAEEKRLYDYNSITDPFFDRVGTPCEARKLFLITDKLRKKESDNLYALLDNFNYKQDSLVIDHPLIAMIGIKLCRDFFYDHHVNGHLKCTAYDCIKNVIDKHTHYKEDNESYALLYSLGAEDLYILCRADHPTQILQTVHVLRDVHCGRICGDCPGLMNPRKSNSPIVLETHTHIGYSSLLEKLVVDSQSVAPFVNHLSDTPFLFEIQIRQYAPSSMNRIISFLNSHKFDKCDIYRTTGRYGLVARSSKICLTDMILLYSDKMLNWRDSQHHQSEVNYTTGRFLLGLEEYNPNVDFDPANGYAKSSCEINKLDLIVEEFLTNINPFIQYFSESHKSQLENLILLYMQATQRLFKTHYWSEFRDIFYFVRHFFEHLNVEVKLLLALDNSDAIGINKSIAVDSLELIEDIFDTINTFYENMFAVLNDRLLLGRPMQENVRIGVYATGAYEDLIQLYRIWLRQLRKLYNCLSGPNDLLSFQPCNFHFLFVPMADNDIFTYDLFDYNRLVYCEHSNENIPQLLATIHMGSKNLWSFQNSLGILCHEIAHYIYQYSPYDQCILLTEMASTHFSSQLAIALANMNYPSFPIGMASAQMDKMRNELCDYLLESLRTFRASAKRTFRSFINSEDFLSLIVGERLLTKLFDSAIRSQFYTNNFSNGLGSNRHANISEDGGKFMHELFRVYYDYEQLQIASIGSPAFYPAIYNYFRAAISVCRSLISECNSDRVCIQLLDIEYSSYLSMLLPAQIDRDNSRADIDPETNRCITAIRIISAAMCCMRNRNPECDTSIASLLKWINSQVSVMKNSSLYDCLCDIVKVAHSLFDNAAPLYSVWGVLWTRNLNKYVVDAYDHLKHALRIYEAKVNDSENIYFNLKSTFKTIPDINQGGKESFLSLLNLMNFASAHHPFKAEDE